MSLAERDDDRDRERERDPDLERERDRDFELDRDLGVADRPRSTLKSVVSTVMFL